MTAKTYLNQLRSLEATIAARKAEAEICERIHEELADLMTCVDIMINFPWINPKKVQEIQISKARRWGERIQKE